MPERPTRNVLPEPAASKSRILSQFPIDPKLASKSIVIPLLNWLVLMSGKSINGPDACAPPGNFHAPVIGSSSNDPGTVADLVALLPRPERS